MRGLLCKLALLSTTLAVLVAFCPGTLPADTATPKKKAGLARDKAPAASKPAEVRSTLPADTKLDASALARHIDQLITQKLQAEKVQISPRSDDAEFLRRVYLDLVGHIPNADQAVAFLDSKDPDKRKKLIDDLLASKEFGKHQADIWQSLMLPRDSIALRLRQFFPNLGKWLEEGFNDNRPWDKTVRELLSATGPINKTGPGVYYVAHQSVDKVTDNFTKVFLGVQLQCAQCHNHPFTDWKQNEYWGMAAFFLKVRPDGNAQMAARNGGTISVIEGNQVVRNRQRLPESAKVLPPKFLQGPEADVKPNDLYRPALSEWATNGKNPFLAKALVNRTWGLLFARGIVNPVDDMHDGNLPSHPELLTDLANQFKASGYDVKHLVRAICNSDAYQRTSRFTGNNKDAGPELFSRMPVKVLTPEQLYDSLVQVTGGPGAGRGPARPGAGARGGPATPRDQFVASWGIEDGSDPTEYQGGIPQVLRLMNGPGFNNPGAVNRILGGKTGTEAIEKLYLATLSRRPTSQELTRMNDYLAKQQADPRQALADVLWALLNCSEFALNH
jgi:hypothetical protein